MILPNATLGLIGGGQLGRMFTMAARNMDYGVTVLDPDPLSPAAEFATTHLNTAYTDLASIETLSASCAGVTTEFENAPAEVLTTLAARTVVRPSGHAVAIAQDRHAEKNFFKSNGFPVGPFAIINCVDDIDIALNDVRLPAVLKTARFGYDGKGQAIIREGDDPDRVWEDLATKSAILEKFIPFEREISVIAARSASGQVECFDVTENEHRDHILKFSYAPADIPEALAQQARGIAEKIASALNYVGVLAVEMFVVQGKDGPTVLVNEIAPRVHNSGHWTLDGASISQFEQHIRAIAGWPLGKPVRHGQVTMTNLIGDDINGYERWLTVPGATVHLYGKGPPRPGRKMGHVTEVTPSRK